MSEKEEVVLAPEEEEVKEEQEQVELTPEEIEAKQKKSALIAFILGLVSFLLGGWFGGLVGIICGAIAISKAKKAKGVAVQPSKIFRILGLVLGILGLVGGILDILALIALCVLVGLGILGGGIYALIVFLIIPLANGEEIFAALALLAL